MKKTLAVWCVFCLLLVADGFAEDGQNILKASGVKGGLVVCIGAENPDFIAGLRVDSKYLVHALDTDQKKVAAARKYIRSKGLYGKVSVDIFDGKNLPYANNLVNLIVVDDQIQVSGIRCQVSGKEIERVLTPRGVAMAKGTINHLPLTINHQSPSGLKGWVKFVKPVPKEIDEWSHFLHDASGDSVADDRQIGPPKSLRWVAGPLWSRSHEFPSSVNAVVTAGGRIFTIFDESVTGIHRKLPMDCKLIARDSSNGLLLWKVPLRNWQMEHGVGKGGRWTIHHTIPRRLIASKDRVYVTLEFLDSPVSVLDAATGDILVEALEGTKGADEMILLGGVLIVKITKGQSVSSWLNLQKDMLDETLAGFDVKTGKQLWRKENVKVAPYALSAYAGRIVYHNMDELVCLAVGTGKEIWRTPNVITSTVGGGSTLVLRDGVVLFHGHGEAGKTVAAAVVKKKGKKEESKKTSKPAKIKSPRGDFLLTALSMDNGNILWQRPGKRAWSQASTLPTEIFVTEDNIVWCASFEGLDLRTGEVRKTLNPKNTISPGHHARCHRGKATIRYLIMPKRGAEFIDTEGDNHMRHDWFRGACFTGVTPANGLLYVPPDQCNCYPGVKVPGYLGLSGDVPDKLKPADETNLQQGPGFVPAELRRGKPGYGKNPKSEIRNPKSDWPMYRHDVQRSGSIKTPVSADLKKLWEVKLSCQGSQAVIVGDRLWVAEKDSHNIRCLNVVDGKDVWNFTAGGRIDSAPTIYGGQRTEDRGQKVGTGSLCLFGCRDGSVYCLNAEDGELVWRFRAAPEDKRLVAFEQVESAWPVSGSVLVQEDKVYFAAGRSSYLDGGIIVYALDVETGKVLHHHVLDGPWPNIKTDAGSPWDMEGALPDLMVSDGKDLYMLRVKFDSTLNRADMKREELGELDMGANHLVATGGFLDDSGFDRLFWMYDKRWPGFYYATESPKSGQLIVFNDSFTYAAKGFYHRHSYSPVFTPGEQGYLLFADANDNEPSFLNEKIKEGLLKWIPEELGKKKSTWKKGGRGVEKGTGYVRAEPEKWQTMVPIRVRAMLLAGDNLFVAGPPDVVDAEDPLASFRGRKGALLRIVSAKDGRKLSEYKFDSEPVFDGMSAANGKLFICLKNGKVECFE
ncbi:PQQ-binding-like beta-propeller repeat protein [Verrucomicrobiota bacterium]